MFGEFLSVYGKGHSTETSLLEILDWVYTVTYDKLFMVLIGLYLSVAFDTVSHEILLERLQAEFGVTGILLTWLQSFLDSRPSS